MRTKAAAGGATLLIGREVIGHCDRLVVDGGIGAAKGKDLLAHELTHLVQQKAGQSVTLRLGGVAQAVAIHLTASQPRTIILQMTDPAGRTFAISGKVVQARPADGARQQEWSITYETIQRVI